MAGALRCDSLGRLTMVNFCISWHQWTKHICVLQLINPRFQDDDSSSHGRGPAGSARCGLGLKKCTLRNQTAYIMVL